MVLYGAQTGYREHAQRLLGEHRCWMEHTRAGGRNTWVAQADTGLYGAHMEHE